MPPMSRHSNLRPHLLALAFLGAWSGAHAAPAAAPGDDLLLPYTVTTHDTLIGLNRALFAAPGVWREVSRINHLPDSNKIAPGQVLLVPARYLHNQVVPARVESAFGDVRIGDGPAASGATLAVGDTIRTGESGTAVVLLADGSHVKLAPNTQGRLDEQRRFQTKATAAAIDDGLVAASLRLVSGSIEVFASKVLRARPLEVTTPTAVIGVRGTAYRVHNDAAPATEVLEGKVHAQVGSDAAQAVDVPAHFGASLEAGRKPQVLPLPPAPDLSALPTQFDRLPLKLHVAGNTALRVQVADDTAFNHIQVDLHVGVGDDIRIPRLADGKWHLRVRRIGAEGLEGLDAVHDFQLRARPESPFLMEPPANAKLPVGDVTLRWTPMPEAARYAVEVARDAQFGQVALRDDNVRGEQLVFHPVATDFGAADGIYWWRVVSIDAGGRRGAWGDAQALVLRPTPRAPIGHLSPDGSAIELMWGGRPEDRVEVELARDPAYQQIAARGDFSAPSAHLARPAAGTYYAHYRFVEPDGFKTAWSGDVRIEVESDWRNFWHVFVPDSLLK
jgi:hypothetical protein